MAEQVTGSIGQEQVVFNNAASEATLLKLLEAIKAAGGSTSKASGIAGAAGIDPKTINAVNEALDQAKNSTTNYSDAEEAAAQKIISSANNTVGSFGLLNSTILGLMNGTQQTSILVGGFGQLIGGVSPVLGMMVAGMAKLLAMQEENFLTYQKLSSSGINFAGSLTQLRMAAADSYLTLDQFSKLMKENSESFAKMGGTANEGAIAFRKVGKELIQSEIGTKLMAMGYTTEEVNSGLANYITMSGGRSAQEMKNTKDLSKAAGEYLTELDDLTQITGKSREQQEQALKEAAANQAYQSYLLTLDEEGKKKASIAMAEAMATGGKGGAEALQAQLMGLPPMTKAAQEFTAIAPRMASANNKMAAAVTDASKGVSDVKKAGDELRIAANQTKQDLGQTGKALVAGGGAFSQTIGTIFGTANRNAQQGVNNLEDAEKQRKSLEANRKAREDSQADDMAKAMAGFKDLGAELWDVFSPLLAGVSFIARLIGGLASGIASVIKAFNGFFDQFGAVGTVLKGATIALIAFVAAQRIATAQAVLKNSIPEALNLGKKGVLPPTGVTGVATKAPTGVTGVATKAPTGVTGVATKAPGALGGVAGTTGGSIGGSIGGMLGGLAEGLKKLGNPQVMLGIVSLGLLSGAMLIAGTAFKEFTGVNWGDVLIGSVVLAGLAVGAAALASVAPFIAISAVAIGLLGGAIWLLAKGLKEFPSLAIPGMTEAFTGFGKIVGTVFDFVGGVITGLLNTIKTVFGVMWDIISWPFKMIGNLVSGTVDVVGSLFGTLWSIVSWPFKQLGTLVSGTASMITNIFSGIVSGISTVFSTLWNVISWPFKQLGTLVTSSVGMITGVFRGMVSGISTVFSTVWNVMSWPFKQLGSLALATVNTITGVFRGMVSGISTVFSTVWNVMSWPFKQIGTLVTSVFGTVWNIVSWPFKQLGNLVTSTSDTITGVFKGMLSGISTIFTTVWDIISWPFKQIGALVTSVFEGISGAIKWVTDKLSNVLGMIGGVIKGIAGFFGRMFGGGDTKTADKGTSSPEFTKATSVLLEAANKMNVAADKLIVSASAISGKTPVVSPSFFDKALSSLTASPVRKEKDVTATPPLAEENIENNTFVRGPSSEEKTVTELAQLNKTMQDILRYMKDTADNTKKNIDATRALNGNLFSA